MSQVKSRPRPMAVANKHSRSNGFGKLRPMAISVSNMSILHKRRLSNPEIDKILLYSPEDMIQEHNELYWIDTVFVLIKDICNQNSYGQNQKIMALDNALRFVISCINTSQEKYFSDQSVYGHSFWSQLTYFWDQLQLCVKGVTLHKEELVRFAAKILSFLIDLKADIGFPAQSCEKLDLLQGLIFLDAHSKDCSVDALLQCKTLYLSGYRKPDVFLPLIKYIVNNLKSSLDIKQFLKLILLVKLTRNIYEDRCSTVLQLLIEFYKHMKALMPSDFLPWAKKNANLNVPSIGLLKIKRIVAHFEIQYTYEILYSSEVSENGSDTESYLTIKSLSKNLINRSIFEDMRPTTQNMEKKPRKPKRKKAKNMSEDAINVKALKSESKVSKDMLEDDGSDGPSVMKLCIQPAKAQKLTTSLLEEKPTKNQKDIQPAKTQKWTTSVLEEKPTKNRKDIQPAKAQKWTTSVLEEKPTKNRKDIQPAKAQKWTSLLEEKPTKNRKERSAIPCQSTGINGWMVSKTPRADEWNVSKASTDHSSIDGWNVSQMVTDADTSQKKLSKRKRSKARDGEIDEAPQNTVKKLKAGELNELNDEWIIRKIDQDDEYKSGAQNYSQKERKSERDTTKKKKDIDMSTSRMLSNISNPLCNLPASFAPSTVSSPLPTNSLKQTKTRDRKILGKSKVDECDTGTQSVSGKKNKIGKVDDECDSSTQSVSGKKKKIGKVDKCDLGTQSISEKKKKIENSLNRKEENTDRSKPVIHSSDISPLCKNILKEKKKQTNIKDISSDSLAKNRTPDSSRPKLSNRGKDSLEEVCKDNSYSDLEVVHQNLISGGDDQENSSDESDIDEASGSDGDIVPNDDSCSMFTKEETALYHKAQKKSMDPAAMKSSVKRTIRNRSKAFKVPDDGDSFNLFEAKNNAMENATVCKENIDKSFFEIDAVGESDEAAGEKVSDETAVGKISDEVAVEELSDEAAEESDDEATVEELSDEAAEESDDEAPVEELSDEAPVKELSDEAPVEELSDEAAEESDDEAPVEEVSDEAAEESDDEATVEELSDEAAEESDYEATVEELSDDAIVEELSDEAPVEVVSDEAAEESDDEATVEELSDEAAVEEPNDEATVEELSDDAIVEVPITSVLQLKANGKNAELTDNMGWFIDGGSVSKIGSLAADSHMPTDNSKTSRKEADEIPSNCNASESSATLTPRNQTVYSHGSKASGKETDEIIVISLLKSKLTDEQVQEPATYMEEKLHTVENASEDLGQDSVQNGVTEDNDICILSNMIGNKDATDIPVVSGQKNLETEGNDSCNLSKIIGNKDHNNIPIVSGQKNLETEGNDNCNLSKMIGNKDTTDNTDIEVISNVSDVSSLFVFNESQNHRDQTLSKIVAAEKLSRGACENTSGNESSDAETQTRKRVKRRISSVSKRKKVHGEKQTPSVQKKNNADEMEGSPDGIENAELSLKISEANDSSCDGIENAELSLKISEANDSSCESVSSVSTVKENSTYATTYKKILDFGDNTDSPSKSSVEILTDESECLKSASIESDASIKSATETLYAFIEKNADSSPSTSHKMSSVNAGMGFENKENIVNNKQVGEEFEMLSTSVAPTNVDDDVTLVEPRKTALKSSAKKDSVQYMSPKKSVQSRKRGNSDGSASKSNVASALTPLKVASAALHNEILISPEVSDEENASHGRRVSSEADSEHISHYIRDEHVLHKSSQLEEEQATDICEKRDTGIAANKRSSKGSGRKSLERTSSSSSKQSPNLPKELSVRKSYRKSLDGSFNKVDDSCVSKTSVRTPKSSPVVSVRTPKSSPVASVRPQKSSPVASARTPKSSPVVSARTPKSSPVVSARTPTSSPVVNIVQREQSSTGKKTSKDKNASPVSNKLDSSDTVRKSPRLSPKATVINTTETKSPTKRESDSTAIDIESEERDTLGSPVRKTATKYMLKRLGISDSPDPVILSSPRRRRNSITSIKSDDVPETQSLASPVRPRIRRNSLSGTLTPVRRSRRISGITVSPLKEEN